MRTQTYENNQVPIGWIIIALLTLLAFFSPAHGEGVSRIETVGFTVSDMDRSLNFYTQILTFEKVSDNEAAGTEFEKLSGVFGARVRIVDLKLGDEKIELTEYLTPGGRPVPQDSRSNDLWFQHVAIIVSDMGKAYETLRTNKVRHASTGPQTLPSYITAAAGIKAFYFKDPDNHVLEILQFPDGKGLRKWHDLAGSGKLFLGIDHTAIVVSNSEFSLKFYRDALGLTVAGTSDNYGPEQEHLNNVPGAKLHITGLRTKEPGIAVEFLEYTAPHGGRVYPQDSGSSDLWHWQTSFVSSDVRTLSDLLTGQFRSQPISAGVEELPNASFGFSRSVLIRDPDGHAIRLQQ